MFIKKKKIKIIIFGVLKKLYLYFKIIINFCIVLFIPELLGICYFIILIFLTTLGMKYVEIIFHNLNPKTNLPDVITGTIKFYYKVDSFLNKVDTWFENLNEWYDKIIFKYITKPYYYDSGNYTVDELEEFSEVFESYGHDIATFIYIFILLMAILFYILIFNLRVFDKIYYYFLMSYYLRKEKRFFFNLYVLNKKFLSEERYNSLVNIHCIYPENTIFYVEDHKYEILLSKIAEFNNEFIETEMSWDKGMTRKNEKLIIRKYKLYRLRDILIYIIQSEKKIK